MIDIADIRKLIEVESNPKEISKMCNILDELANYAHIRKQTLEILEEVGIDTTEPFLIEYGDNEGTTDRDWNGPRKMVHIVYNGEVVYSAKKTGITISFSAIIKLYLKFGKKLYAIVEKCGLNIGWEPEEREFPNFDLPEEDYLDSTWFCEMNRDQLLIALISGVWINTESLVDIGLFDVIFDTSRKHLDAFKGNAEVYNRVFSESAKDYADFMECLKIMHDAGLEKTYYYMHAENADDADPDTDEYDICQECVPYQYFEHGTKKIGVYELATNWKRYRDSAKYLISNNELISSLIFERNDIIDAESEEICAIEEIIAKLNTFANRRCKCKCKCDERKLNETLEKFFSSVKCEDDA